MAHDSHEHDHDHHQALPSDPALRVKALESLLVEKGMVDRAGLDALVDTYEHKIGPRNGARVVARAWVDAAYRERLLANANSAIAELGYGGFQGEHMVAVENTSQVQNLVVCTLCSCYPWAVPWAFRRYGTSPRRIVRAPSSLLSACSGSSALRGAGIRGSRMGQYRGDPLPRGSATPTGDGTSVGRAAGADCHPRLHDRGSENSRGHGSARDMNGVHDMGGMHGFGPIPYEHNEPVFHAPWEKRAFGVVLSMDAWSRWTLDGFRYQLEQIPPVDYLRMSYYEKWLEALAQLLLTTGLVDRAELESGRPAMGSARVMPVVTPEVAVMMVTGGAPVNRDVTAPARFAAGDRVRARNVNPVGHTRLPRYVRGKLGTIERDQGVFVFPDTNAKGAGETPQRVFSVRFTARELWGADVPEQDAVFVDAWDDYLEPA